jgi:hypothetical protein
MDSSPYYCVPAALEFRARVCGGEAALMRYIRLSMREGGDRVAELLGTEVMANAADKDADQGVGTGGLRDCAFANVRLPVDILGEQQQQQHGAARDGGIAQEEVRRVVDYMQETFLGEFDTFIAVYEYKGRLWARLAGQVYLDLQDWEWCAGVLKEVCGRVRKGVFRDGDREVGEGKEMEGGERGVMAEVEEGIERLSVKDVDE